MRINKIIKKSSKIRKIEYIFINRRQAMYFIKCILIILVLFLFYRIGTLYSKKYINRVEQLEKIKEMLNIFKAKVNFTCSTIQEIFSQLYIDNNNNIGEIFNQANIYMEDNTAKDAWEKSLDETKEKTNFTDEDIIVLKTLGKMLGETDLQGQISQIELTQSLLNSQIKEAQEEKVKNSKMYKTLGITVGLAVGIILI